MDLVFSFEIMYVNPVFRYLIPNKLYHNYFL